MEAAEAFTEAIDCTDGLTEISPSLERQIITLLNNRSAMYEKGGQPELALSDCETILEKDMNHTKARTRRLRVLESLKRWDEALVEVCAIQLLFMQANRANLRMGLPTPPPPVAPSKMEEILGHILPAEIEKYSNKLESEKKALPSKYTIFQLLKSYSDYNKWMSQAAKDGPVDSITLKDATDSLSKADRAVALMKRGRRFVYDGDLHSAIQAIEEGYKLVSGDSQTENLMEGDNYARLMEWTGMVRHWQYDLPGAMAAYEKCAAAEPTNAIIPVKQAGVQMDAGKQEQALKLFDTALGLDRKSVDALMHRSNLFMLQQDPEKAKKDLQNLLNIQPNHVMARLRMASIFSALNDTKSAEVHLDKAETVEPNSSEVASYRGELAFTTGDMSLAQEHFKKAIELEPSNPTPYINVAMAILNTQPPAGQVPDAPAAIESLEKAIEVDPMYTAAYIQLGQLKLGTATELENARGVVDLYDKALSNCRSPEEIKELCSMRCLAVAQIDAATMLKMVTFNM